MLKLLLKRLNKNKKNIRRRTAKKISGKYRKLRKYKNVDLVADVQETLNNKNACIAAQKIS